MWFSEFHTPDVKHSIRVNRQLFSRQSDYQRIDIFETPEFGRVLTLDGNVMLTERDEFIYDEMITHVPMAVHKEARDILVIGADTLSKIVDWSDRSTCVLFGDGAGAAVLRVEEGEKSGIFAMKMGSDGKKGPVLSCVSRTVGNSCSQYRR